MSNNNQLPASIKQQPGTVYGRAVVPVFVAFDPETGEIEKVVIDDEALTDVDAIYGPGWEPLDLPAEDLDAINDVLNNREWPAWDFGW